MHDILGRRESVFKLQQALQIFKLCHTQTAFFLSGLSAPPPLLPALAQAHLPGWSTRISRLLSLPGSHTEVFSSHEHPARLTHSVLAFRLLGGLERVTRLCLCHGLELHHKQLGIVAHVCICNTWKLRQADPAWS